MQHLAPRAVWLFFFMNIFVFFISYLVLVFIFSSFLLTFIGKSSSSYIESVFLLEIVTLFAVPILSFLWARLTYDRYKYELRQNGFRKEHGVIRKKYVTIPYERIQNVDIYRGILARLLGLSDLQIQTAGMSTGFGSYGAGSEGRLLGLTPEDAEKIRDELIKRAKGSQGL